MDSIGSNTGTPQVYQRPSVGAAAATTATAQVDGAQANPGMTATQKRDRLDTSDQIHQSFHGVAQRDDPADAQKAMARRPADSKEAIQARDDYAMYQKDLTGMRGRAMTDMKQFGADGQSHDLADGTKVSFSRNEQGRTVGTYTTKGETSTIEFNEKDESYIKSGARSGDFWCSSEKDGNRITTHSSGGDRDTFEVHGDALSVTHATPNGSYHQTTAWSDGSATIQDGSKQDDGTMKVQEHAVPMDHDRAARDKIVRQDSYVLDAQGHRQAPSEDQIAKITDGVEGYPPEVLQKLHDGGMKYAVVDPKQVPPGGYPGGLQTWGKDAEGKGEAGAYFTSKTNTVVLRGDEEIDHRKTSHEVGHAVDHMLAEKKGGFLGMGGEKGFASEDDKKLQGLFDDYKARGGTGFSEYSHTNPQEYWAEGFRAYTEDPQGLKKTDPGMYAYVQQRMQQAAHR